VYGGGAITPDVIVAPDTLSQAEQAFRRAIAPSFQKYFNHIALIAEGQKGKVKPDFAVNPAWREELFQKLTADTVKIDKAIWDGGAPDIDRAIEDRVAKVAFGDTLVRRRSLKDDNQLRAAIDLLKKAATQRDVFTAAGSAPAVTKAGVARRSGN
jgi:carboxyl-terminal processing protease